MILPKPPPVVRLRLLSLVITGLNPYHPGPADAGWSSLAARRAHNPKSHTSEALRAVRQNQQPMVITQHGEAKAVLQDIVSYEQMQDSLALLKMLAQSSRNIRDGRSKPVKAAFANVRKRVKASTE